MFTSPVGSQCLFMASLWNAPQRYRLEQKHNVIFLHLSNIRPCVWYVSIWMANKQQTNKHLPFIIIHSSVSFPSVLVFLLLLNHFQPLLPQIALAAHILHKLLRYLLGPFQRDSGPAFVDVLTLSRHHRHQPQWILQGEDPFCRSLFLLGPNISQNVSCPVSCPIITLINSWTV